AGMIAHGFTVLTLRRSILTEKVSRRGYHLSREYSIDPLEIIFAREVVRAGGAVLPADATPGRGRLPGEGGRTRGDAAADREQRLFPVVAADGRLAGVVTRRDLRRWLDAAERQLLSDVMRRPIVAHDDEPLRVVVFRMAETGLTRLPVITRDGTLIGMV